MTEQNKPRLLTAENFDRDVLQSEVPVLVDFWAEWCGPCRTLGPTIEGLANEYGDRALIGKVDVDEHQSLALRYGIRSIPTVMLFHEGEARETLVGVRPQQEYAAQLDRLAG